MARLLAAGEALVEVGVMGLRAPDGSFTENVKLYKIVSSGDVNPKTRMTAEEEGLCEDIGAIFAAKMKQYIDGGGLMPQPITKGA